MADIVHLELVERTLRFEYRDKSQLRLALTAGGADVDNVEGNRTLAQVGDGALGLSIAMDAFRTGMSRAKLAKERESVFDKERRAKTAHSLGLDECIRYSKRSRSDRVVGLAVSALIGAAFLQTGAIASVEQIVTVLQQVHDAELIAQRLTQDTSLRRQQAIISSPEVFVRERVRQLAESPILHSFSTGPSLLELEYGFDSSSGPWDVLAPPLSLTSPDEPEDVTVARASFSNLGQIVADTTLLDFTCRSDTDGLLDIYTSTVEAVESSLTACSDGLGIADVSSPSDGTISIHRDCTGQSATSRSSNTSDSIPRRRPFERSQDVAAPSGWCLTGLPSSKRQPPGALIRPPGRLGDDRTRHMKADCYTLTAQSHALLALFAADICSSQTVSNLLAVVRSCREPRVAHIPPPDQPLRTAQRFELIKHLLIDLNATSVFVMGHILKLWQNTKLDTFQVTPASDYSRKRPRLTTPKPGNAHTRLVSDRIKSLFQREFPDLNEAMPEYDPLYRQFKKFRLVGRNLEMFEVAFGAGVLGLLLCSGAFSQISSNVVNSTFSTISRKDLEIILEILQKTQGEAIKRFSQRVEPLVVSLMNGTLHQHGYFALEQRADDEIRATVDGSEELLSLL